MKKSQRAKPFDPTLQELLQPVIDILSEMPPDRRRIIGKLLLQTARAYVRCIKIEGKCGTRDSMSQPGQPTTVREIDSIETCDLYLPALEAVVVADNAFEFRAPEHDCPERSALESAMHAQRDVLAAVIDAHVAAQLAATFRPHATE